MEVASKVSAVIQKYSLKTTTPQALPLLSVAQTSYKLGLGTTRFSVGSMVLDMDLAWGRREGQGMTARHRVSEGKKKMERRRCYQFNNPITQKGELCLSSDTQLRA